jgi:hypothetical protein
MRPGEGRMVGEAQIAAEPHDRRRGGWNIHYPIIHGAVTGGPGVDATLWTRIATAGDHPAQTGSTP